VFYLHNFLPMATPIPQETKAKIISSIKDDGLTVTGASETYHVTEETIRKWLRGTIENSGTSGSEVQRLRKENQMLKEIIGTLIFDRETSKKNLTRPGDSTK